MPLSPLQHFFTSFGARDRCFLLIFRLWQNALLEKVALGEAWAGARNGPPGTPALCGHQVLGTCSFLHSRHQGAGKGSRPGPLSRVHGRELV